MQHAPSLTNDFTYATKVYHAEIWHYAELTKAEAETYRVTENTFLAHVTGHGKDLYFELYIAEDLEWYSTVEFDGPTEFIAILGRVIDSFYA